MTERISWSERRSFLARLSAGVTAVAAVVTGSRTAHGQSLNLTKWQPERYEKDDWLDKVATKHRLVFDTTTPDGLGEAIAFANNFIRVNRTDYGVQNDALAVVIVVRHRSTAFAYSDAIWAKYGVPIAGRAQFTDPKTKSAPKVNLYNVTDYGAQLPNRGTTLDSLLKQGVQLAVCQVATRGIAGSIAEATGGNTDAIYNELVSSIGNGARMVPAGIVALNRAQERGYSFVSA
jgi:intracellular sulfur oxidation DsrE/DsrF family protein